MTTDGLLALGAVYLWSVFLHSFLAGLVFYAWARYLGLRPGAQRRRMLIILLLLPLVTAAVPGRHGLAFREDTAWFDSGRLLAIPLFQGVRTAHVVALLGLATALITLWQEVVPIFRRPVFSRRPLPSRWAARIRSKTGWEGSLEVVDDSDLAAAVTNGPDRPRLLLSKRLAEGLDQESLEAVIRHEQAHRHRPRWLGQHLLFGVRLLQIFNPVALWVFREYCIEVEIVCDAEAVSNGSPRPLARALLAVYRGTDPKDISSREVLRERIDVLLGRRETRARELPATTLALATILLAALLPWIV